MISKSSLAQASKKECRPIDSVAAGPLGQANDHPGLYCEALFR
jgi:hypothetical protein